MNKLPLTVPSFPLIRPDQLTAPAQALYAQLNDRAQPHDVQAAVDANESAAAEIMTAGLAVVGGDGYPAKREASEHYVRATGKDSVRVVVRLIHPENPEGRGPAAGSLRRSPGGHDPPRGQAHAGDQRLHHRRRARL